MRLPEEEWPKNAPRAAIHVAPKREWFKIAGELVELEPAAPITDERIFKVGNREVLAGAFGAAKRGAPAVGQQCAQRLINHTMPANSF